MKRILISAMNSSSGKTVMVCTLLRALQRRGLQPDAVKCGPDYIDPMFHRRVLGVPTGNLDLFLQGKAGVVQSLQARESGDITVFEGAMGFFDGRGGTTDCSAWETSVVTRTPAVLVLRPSGSSITLAAQVRGLQQFRKPDTIRGLLLNDCKPALFAHLKPLLERETGLPVLGYLPHMEEASLESRHLGLKTAAEIDDFSARFDRLAEALEANCDLDALLALAEDYPLPDLQKQTSAAYPCRIAVARDEAFCFYYEENLEALRRSGAELMFFSPLSNDSLPDCDGLYLGGGYPELYADRLAENVTLLQDIRSKLEAGLPTVAECGGFMYLQQRIGDHCMVGALPGEAFRTERLQRFGYTTLISEEASLLFLPGEEIPSHEFHYWDCTDNGHSLRAVKGAGREARCGFTSPSLYAAYPHLHFGGALPLAERFCKAAAHYDSLKGGHL